MLFPAKIDVNISSYTDLSNLALHLSKMLHVISHENLTTMKIKYIAQLGSVIWYHMLYLKIHLKDFFK